MAQLLDAYICLDNVPEDVVREGKNGKKYLSFYLSERQTVGQYGETHAAYILKPAAGAQMYDKVYIGSAKPFEKRK